ncbi:hypothetical protein KIPB_002228, partial [Kipferlia bialata]
VIMYNSDTKPNQSDLEELDTLTQLAEYYADDPSLRPPALAWLIQKADILRWGMTAQDYISEAIRQDKGGHSSSIELYDPLAALRIVAPTLDASRWKDLPNTSFDTLRPEYRSNVTSVLDYVSTVQQRREISRNGPQTLAYIKAVLDVLAKAPLSHAPSYLSGLLLHQRDEFRRATSVLLSGLSDSLPVSEADLDVRLEQACAHASASASLFLLPQAEREQEVRLLSDTWHSRNVEASHTACSAYLSAVHDAVADWTSRVTQGMLAGGVSIADITDFSLDVPARALRDGCWGVARERTLASLAQVSEDVAQAQDEFLADLLSRFIRPLASGVAVALLLRYVFGPLLGDGRGGVSGVVRSVLRLALGLSVLLTGWLLTAKAMPEIGSLRLLVFVMSNSRNISIGVFASLGLYGLVSLRGLVHRGSGRGQTQGSIVRYKAGGAEAGDMEVSEDEELDDTEPEWYGERQPARGMRRPFQKAARTENGSLSLTGSIPTSTAVIEPSPARPVRRAQMRHLGTGDIGGREGHMHMGQGEPMGAYGTNSGASRVSQGYTSHQGVSLIPQSSSALVPSHPITNEGEVGYIPRGQGSSGEVTPSFGAGGPPDPQAISNMMQSLNVTSVQRPGYPIPAPGTGAEMRSPPKTPGGGRVVSRTL